MPKEVRAPNGAMIWVDDNCEWHGFRGGDIVTSERENSQWFGKRVVLDGIDLRHPNIMYGAIAGPDFSYFDNNPDGLILLERPGLRFKFKDRANIYSIAFDLPRMQSVYGQCIIIAINPVNDVFLVKLVNQTRRSLLFADWMPQIARQGSGYYVASSLELSPLPTDDASTEPQTLPERVSSVITDGVRRRSKVGGYRELDVEEMADEFKRIIQGTVQRGGSANEEIIIDAEHVSHSIDTSKTFFGFKAGDIITCDEGELKDKRIRVRGVEIGGFLFGKIIGERRILRTNNTYGLILLERRNFPFRVGDKVMRTDLSCPCVATVLVLRPDSIDSILIEYEDLTGGDWNYFHIMTRDYLNNKPPWYPQNYYLERSDTTINNRTVVPARVLSIVKAVHQKKQRESDSVSKAAEETQELVQSPETPEEPAVVLPPPAWFEELSVDIQAKRAHFFIIHGNIYDWQRNAQGKRVALRQYLAEAYRDSMVIYYSLSEGISFNSPDDEQWFRNRLAPAQREDAANSARQKLAQKVQGARASGANLGDLVGRAPDAVLPMLERLLAADEKEAPKKRVLIIESAHNIAPRQITPAERATVETLERWARAERFQKCGSLVILSTPSKTQIAESLSSSFSGARTIRVPKPDEAGRISYWQEAIVDSGLQLAEELSAESLGRLTGGLSLRQIDDLCALAKVKGGKIESAFVKEEKRRILDNEFGDRVNIKVPKFGFEFFGGKENVRAHLLQIRDDILRGMTRRAPMGILASGPPGTGKTFLFECWANECGFNFVEMENVRSKWVGESEEIMEKILAALDDLSPVIVVEDEADQSEPSRDAPSGDSGVSSRLRQMKFKFCSEPKRRGRVVWVRISNRDDLLDAAYKRKGRTDDNIPFVLPSEVEYIKIFEVMFRRYSIATTITDFAPLAKLVAERIYCTGADVEWMVLEADKLAGADGKESVEPEHLQRAIADWEMDLDPNDVDNQIILAIKGSSKRLRPENWEKVLADAERRIEERAKAFLPQLSPVKNGNGVK